MSASGGTLRRPPRPAESVHEKSLVLGSSRPPGQISRLLLIIAFVAQSPAGTAASYDCRAPQTTAQRTICRTPQLDRLDEQYIVRYNNLRLRMEQAGTYTNAIRDVDANRAELWDKINACPPQDVDCMATAYRFQLAGLHACFPQDPKPDSPECAQTKGTLRFAQASQCTYQTDATRNNPQACGPDWEVVKPAELHMKNIDFHDEESGFDAILLRGRKNGEHLLAFRGTNETERNDWLNNLQQAAGHVAKQYKQARDLARKLQNALPPGSVIRTTGHSLGGGLATTTALAFHAPAVVFNAAALQPTVARQLDLNYAEAPARVTHYVMEKDPLTFVQDHPAASAVALISVLGPPARMMNLDQAAIAAHPELAASAAELLVKAPWVRPAPGRREHLPSPDGLHLNPLYYHDIQTVIEALAKRADALHCQRY